MLKKLMLAALAASALALNAPAAVAGPDGPDSFDCGFDSNQQDNVTGQNYEGVIYGYVAHAGDAGISIRCYLTVNGTDVGGVSATGDNFAAGASRITFAAEDTDDVKLCYTVETDHGTQTGCFETTHIQIPPQEVIDLINSVLEQVDPTICPLLAALAGSYGVITIGPDGDVYIGGVLWYDCPPYVG